MAELSLFEILKNAGIAMIQSKVFILFILEAIVLLIALIFKNFINKKMVKSVCIIASLILVGFYISNYVETVVTFINNVSTQLIEFIFFPTTLEFMIVIITSFLIMIFTLLNKKTSKIVRIINSILPISISFIFLSIIEFINVNNIEFNEFTTFTNVNLMSLYELGMGFFISWIVGLIIYKVDIFVLNKVNENEIVIPKTKDKVELPKLKINNI